jgi:two-component system KDP operon response regulator KdpE
MRKIRILVADDELTIIKFLRATLEARGYEVLAAINGVEALQKLGMELPDLVILDIMMPEMDGFEVCRRLREWSQIPVIMLSARSDEKDKVKCLSIGADDYLTKPFGIEELVARVNAVLRRVKIASTASTQPAFESGDLKVNFVERQVTVNNRNVKLTPTEYNLLVELVLNANKVLTHNMLLTKVWGVEYGQEKEYLRVFVRRLRKIIEADPDNPRRIITVPAVGYKFQTAA